MIRPYPPKMKVAATTIAHSRAQHSIASLNSSVLMVRSFYLSSLNSESAGYVIRLMKRPDTTSPGEPQMNSPPKTAIMAKINAISAIL